MARRAPVAGLAMVVVAGALFAHGVAPSWRDFGMPDEDVRSQAAYVARTMHPNDIVLVSSSGNWGFAYYSPHDSAFAAKDETVSTGFVMRVRDPNVIIAAGRDSASIRGALRDATRRQRTAPGSRIFVVCTHMLPAESRAWTDAFVALGLHPRVVPTGVEPLLVIDPVG